MIRNKINKKVYIGESIDIHKRWESHKKDMLSGTHNRKLRKDMESYGLDAFEFNVIKEVPSKGLSTYKHCLLLLIYEDLYIRKYDSVNKGYNCQYTLNCIRDGRKKIINTKIGLKTTNNLIDILYGTIKENNGEYSLDMEAKYREKYNLNKIDNKTLLNFKLKKSYRNYEFVNQMVSLIEDNKDKIIDNIISDYSYNVHERTDLYEYIETYLKFVERFKFAIGEYIYAVKYMHEDITQKDYEYYDVSRYFTYDEFKIIKKDIRLNFNNIDVEKILKVIYSSSTILFYDNNFEIPTALIDGVLEGISIDYCENKDTISYKYDDFGDIIDLFSSEDEMMEYLDSF